MRPPDCLIAQVDRLFARVWHYFDKIAVVGADAHGVQELLDAGRPERARAWILGMIRVILHARATGADEFLVFVDKPPACAVHWQGFFEDPSLHLADDTIASISEEMLRSGKVSFEKRSRGGEFVYRGRGMWLGSESVEASQVRDLVGEGLSVNEAVVRRVLQRYQLGAASDLYASEELDVPVGAGIELEARLLEALRPTLTEAQVAFNIKLPALDGLRIQDLLAIRRDENAAFEAFRSSLREAMKERVAADGSGDPARIATEIENDVIEPTLVDIRRRLELAESALTRKRVIHGGLIGVSTVCGLLGAAPVGLALAGATMASAANTEMRAVDAHTEIEASNMYFLWRVTHQANIDRRSTPKKKRKKR